MAKVVWEKVKTYNYGTMGEVCDEGNTYRAKVPGGWLVRNEYKGSEGLGIGLTFLPDPNHAWK